MSDASVDNQSSDAMCNILPCCQTIPKVPDRTSEILIVQIPEICLIAAAGREEKQVLSHPTEYLGLVFASSGRKKKAPVVSRKPDRCKVSGYRIIVWDV